MKDFTEATVDELRAAKAILELRIALIEMHGALAQYANNMNSDNRRKVTGLANQTLRLAVELGSNDL